MLTTAYILPEPEDAKKAWHGGRSDQFVILLAALADQQTDRCLIAYTRRGGLEGAAAATELAAALLITTSRSLTCCD